MSSYRIRFRTVRFMLSILVMIIGLTLQTAVCIAVDKPVDSQGPAIASNSAKTPSSDNSTQPERAAKSRKSAEQEVEDGQQLNLLPVPPLLALNHEFPLSVDFNTPSA